MKTGFSEDNNEKFSEIYKELDPMLYNTTSKNTDFILAHGVEIDTLRGIRNVLEHGKVNGSYPVAVSDESLQTLSSIVALLKTPCSKVGANRLVSTSPEKPFAEVVKAMADNNFSYIPVLDADGKLLGVISENSILRMMASGKNEGAVYDKNTKVADFMDFFKIENDMNEYFEFRPGNSYLYEIDSEFSRYDDKGRRLGAIFFTVNGRPDQKVMGLITSWDMLPYLSKTFRYRIANWQK
jgi:CBS domain-containing protein